MRRVRLSELEGSTEFALLGAGFRGPGFTLVEPGDGDDELVLAPHEGPLLRVRGRSEAVELDLDVTPPRLNPELDASRHPGAVAAIRAAIAAGDVYQVCFTERARVTGVPASGVFAALCARGVPRFAAWVRGAGFPEIVSASPELLLSVHGDRVMSEPMKGTAAPGDADRLRASEKDQAELAMITDLVRNDLTPVCVPRSVRVAAERVLLELPYAVQAVSRVEGRLIPGLGPLDALAALAPGGSVTGAPKHAALEILAALEASPRGALFGALGLVGNRDAAFSLLIRTAVRDGPASFTYGVGSGIVWDSDAALELQELHTKLGALG